MPGPEVATSKRRTVATWFAPAGRADQEILVRQKKSVLEVPMLSEVLDHLHEMVLILNQHRQIVYANRRFTEFVGCADPTDVLNLRPGEALDCVHALAVDTPDGCGTSAFCRNCGVVRAILDAQNGQDSIEECVIDRKDRPEPVNLRVRTRPVQIGDEQFCLYAVEDISHEKRRRELERVFFHDIINIADGLRHGAELLKIAPAEKHDQIREYLGNGALRLLDEITSQRTLAAAERNELECYPVEVSVVAFLEDIQRLFDGHPIATDRHLVLARPIEERVIETDRGLLSRVVVNMIKNALEATPRGGTVKFGSAPAGEAVRFWVHNAGVISDDVAMQVFGRSFSTKGSGRGLGTYSMRLLGERYLNGRVTFTSDETKGTVFSAVIPLRRSA